ncbi:calcium-dependent protein kinase 31-like [Mizuhopecten yessoensis]|uniref:Calcium-dependent protein kinase 31 n=1 Tax=Mizuhopecten yessoensis TaxID=6573 RepID=A0A210PWT4_MIZYE|nr:calcium-dependent protein kinase 31-like [Mizuhopecten yessoensis]OWF40934.1 Calcium-dependent protein kinase 31 [Mizuhopecten yessoensis]
MYTQRVYLLSLFLGLALSATHHNHNLGGGTLITDIVDRLWINADINDDSELSEPEFLREFIDNFDRDGQHTVSETEFIHQWSHSYHEHKDFTQLVFQHFDLDGDGTLTESDLHRLFNHMDLNADTQISKAEFTTMMAYVFGRLPYE